jgi:hypothetical protein
MLEDLGARPPPAERILVVRREGARGAIDQTPLLRELQERTSRYA